MGNADLTVEQIKSRRVLYLVFATVTLMAVGLIYAWSIFAAPIGQSFPEYGPMLPQVFQVSMFSFCLSALLGAQIVKRFSAKVAIIFGGALMAAGFVTTALFAGAGPWALILCYSVIAGSGCGITYNAIISFVNPWFPDKIGLASGIQMMGAGISSLIFGSLINAMFETMDWTLVFYAIALVTFVVMTLFALTVKAAPQDIASKLGMSKSAAAAVDSPTQKQFILKTKAFWFYCMWATITIACGLTLIGTAAQGALSLNLDETVFAGFGALLVGLVSTMNGAGRIINGAIFDKIGLLPVMLLSSVLSCIAMVSLSSAMALGIGPLYIVAAILVALPYAAVPVMASAFARQRFGASNFSMNLGISNLNIATAAILNISIVALLGSPAGEGGPVIYGILAALAIAAFASAFIFGRFYKKDLTQIATELGQP